ncbi:SRPBCC family protein [Bacillus sp. SD088]|uniref:SRPBCC family protein n=1 Tax=Bacillus sp. SD088 TaxID=2782012 RepID=UPI001A96EDC9|nr:SRPBCC family protein [Bacillus sp. SD088]MBO0994144.1 SRPBCC family protein [Bacillus sp. SD088]
MLATIKQVDDGYMAQFERHFQHSVDRVWAMLTDNQKLKLWFPELSIVELREGGSIQFDMQDGTYEEMTITSYSPQSILAFTWADDLVRFELYEESAGCFCIMKEELQTITEHTPRDLAGWHVCLDVIQALLDGREIETRKQEWEKWYEQYRDAVHKLS